MHNLTYLFLDILFGIPFLFLLRYKKVLLKKKSLYIAAFMISILWTITFDQLGVATNTWSYDQSLTVGVKIGYSNIETFLFAFLITLMVASLIVIFSPNEEKKKSL